MTHDVLDELDRTIIYALQRDARKTAANDVAERMDVSPSTVRNRIQRLEEEGIIRGYHADIDYERAGFQLFTLITCTAPIPDREDLVAAARRVDGVVHVREVMTGVENVHIAAVGRDGDDLSRIGRELSALGLQIADEDVIRSEHAVPYAGFIESA